MQPPPFIPGLQLCGGFYREAVRPILDTHFPGLPYRRAHRAQVRDAGI